MSGSFGRSGNLVTQPLPRLENNTADPINDITISPGEFIAGGEIAAITESFTKKLDETWAEGAGRGGRFAGVSLADITYHVFAIHNDQGSVDVGFDTSEIAQNAPTGWTAKRIGSILRLNNEIRGFVQVGAFFQLKNLDTADLDGVAIPLGVDNLYRVSVPTGLRVIYKGHISPGLAEAGYGLVLLIQDPEQNPTQPTAGSFITGFRGSASAYHAGAFFTSESCEVSVITNRSGEVRISRAGLYLDNSSYWSTLQPRGWIDMELLGAK